ncbi:hypothetical protein D3C74_298070 [compost metagenome]
MTIQLDIEVLAADREIRRIIFDRVIQFEISGPHRGNNVCGGMGLREHVLNLQARVDVPLRHFAFLHFLDPFRCQPFPLTNALRNFKGQSCIHPRFIDQEQHNIVPTTNYGFDVAGSVLDQLLRVPKPYPSSV